MEHCCGGGGACGGGGGAGAAAGAWQQAARLTREHWHTQTHIGLTRSKREGEEKIKFALTLYLGIK